MEVGCSFVLVPFLGGGAAMHNAMLGPLGAVEAGWPRFGGVRRVWDTAPAPQIPVLTRFSVDGSGGDSVDGLAGRWCVVAATAWLATAWVASGGRR